MSLVVALAVALAPSSAGLAPSSAGLVRVAAAADLSDAFTAVARAFEARTGTHAELVFGSSGLLARQLAEGAPYDVFAAADTAFARAAASSGSCDPASLAPYARGHLVLRVARGIAPPAALADLRQPRFRKIALANPDHAPYGRAAREALQRAGLWTELEPRLVYAGNVRQALQYVQGGDVEAAFVAASLSADGLAAVPMRDDLHAPLEQSLVACTRGAAAAAGRAFAAFVLSAEGRKLLAAYGLTPP